MTFISGLDLMDAQSCSDAPEKSHPDVTKRPCPTAILEFFRLPIDFKSARVLAPNLYQDLELLESSPGSEQVPFYNSVFCPTTDIGKVLLKKWASRYTVDIPFLRDSQKLYLQPNLPSADSKLTEKVWKLWGEIRDQDNFMEKYQYIEWELFRWLNKSTAFLTFSSFYSLLSPLFNLLAPVLLLIIPFFVLRVMKVPITVKNYTAALLDQLKKYSFGKLFTHFDKVGWSQRSYLMICFGMYIYNIYQNAIACYKFHRNSKRIGSVIGTFKTYFHYIRGRLEGYLLRISDLASYAPYATYLNSKLKLLKGIEAQLMGIPIVLIRPTALSSLGEAFKQFYLMHESKKIEECVMFSFAFEGYMETLMGLATNVKSGLLGIARYSSLGKCGGTLKGAWFPCKAEQVVVNDIRLSRNMVVTGPNAAGKTTILKSALANLLLSQQVGVGFYRKAKVTPFDYIHCYLNIPDTSSRDSLFQAEARRCLSILDLVERDPTKSHFCIFDELYSGTNPMEAISSAYSYLDYISKNPKVRFILTTHFTKLCALFETNRRIRNQHMGTFVKDGRLRHTYQLNKGISDTKGGLCVLRRLGYPTVLIEMAEKTMDNI